MTTEASRNSSRIVAKYQQHSPLKGRLLEEEALSSNAGLPPPSVLRVAAPNTSASFTKEANRPVSVPTLSMQEKLSNWQYTLAKPVTAQQPRTNRTWRNSLDIRSSRDPPQADSRSLHSSGTLRDSMQSSRSGYWKGQKLTANKRGRGPGNSRASSRQPKNMQVMSQMEQVMAHMGTDWSLPEGADADSKQHSTLYAHVESRLVAGGFIPKVPDGVLATNMDHGFADLEGARDEAMQILRDTMHPMHNGKVNTATVELALANKLATMHKLSQHSDELAKQMDEYRAAPGRMQQWLADAHHRQQEASETKLDLGPNANRAQPKYPLGPSHGARLSPARAPQGAPIAPVDPARMGNKGADDFFTGLQMLDLHRAAAAPQLDVRAMQGGAQQQGGSAALDSGVMNKHELQGRLVEYFHGNAALADDCLQAIWDLAQPAGNGAQQGVSSSFNFWGDWKEVIPEDGNPFPSRPGTTQEFGMRGFTPSIGRPDSRSITSAQSSPANYRPSSRALRPTPVPASAAASAALPPGTALGLQSPAARVEALGKKHWHKVLFPASEPATNHSLDMVEQWIVAMVEHLGIDMGDVLFAERERLNGPPATQKKVPGNDELQVGELGDKPAPGSLVEPTKFFEKAFLLYGVAYLELVRQVTIQSAHRGELLLRLWHSVCKLLSGLLQSMEKQLSKDKEKFDASYQKGFQDGKLEGDGSVAHWKAKVTSTSNFLEQQRSKWREEKTVLHQDMANKDLTMKQMQAELDSSREKLSELLEKSGGSKSSPR